MYKIALFLFLFGFFTSTSFANIFLEGTVWHCTEHDLFLFPVVDIGSSNNYYIFENGERYDCHDYSCVAKNRRWSGYEIIGLGVAYLCFGCNHPVIPFFAFSYELGIYNTFLGKTLAFSFTGGIYYFFGQPWWPAAIQLGYKNCDLINQNDILYVIDDFQISASHLGDLTFDGNDLWFIDSDDRELYKLDLDGDINTAYGKIEYLKAPGSHPEGLAFDGTHLWLSDSDDGMIYKLENSSYVIDSYFLRDVRYPEGLAFDGTHLWLAATLRDGDLYYEKIYKLDTSGNIINSFDSPISYPTGLTFDGTYLWLANHEDNRIYKSDISGNIIEAFDAPGERPPRGLTFDGTYLWVAAPLPYGSGGTIYQLDTSGNIVDSFPSPAEGVGGLTFDGTYLWLADYPHNPKLYKLDTSGNVIDSFTAPFLQRDPGPVGGLAFDGTYLWVVRKEGNFCRIFKVEYSEKVLSSFQAPGPHPEGLTFDGTYLWVADSDEDKLYKLDTAGNVMDSFDSPGSHPEGLTFDGTYLWLGDSDDGMIYKLAANGDVMDSFKSTYPSPQGLAFDGAYLFHGYNREGLIREINKSEIR